MLGRAFKITRYVDRSGHPTAAGLGSVTVLLVALLLAGCQVPQKGLNLGSSDAAPKPIAATAKPKPIPLEATPAVAHEAINIAPSVRLSGDPKELLGLDHAAVRRALGDPTRIRSEDPAQVWQYVTGDCVVDLYLYTHSGGLKVTYVEARSHTAESAPTARCLKSLLERPTASAD